MTFGLGLPRLMRSIARATAPRAREARRFSVDDLLDELPRALSQGARASTLVPALEVDDKPGELIVRAEIPGFAKDDVKVEVEGDHLTIRGESREESDDQNRYFKRVGKFSETLHIRGLASLGQDAVQASMKQGYLVVRVPRPGGAVGGRREVPVIDTEGGRGAGSGLAAAGQATRDSPHETGHHGHKWNVREGRDECHPSFTDEGPADRPFGGEPGKDEPKGEDFKIARAAA
eukprot:tig00021127_g18722.t1